MKRFIILSLLAQFFIGTAFAQHENAVLLKSDTVRGRSFDEVATGINGLIVDNSKDPRARYNWFVDGAIGGGFYTAELNRIFESPLTRMRLAGQLSIGKWVLPHWAVRLAMGYGKFSCKYYEPNLLNVFETGDLKYHSKLPDEAVEYCYHDDVSGCDFFKREFSIFDVQFDIMYDVNRLFTKRKTPFDTYLYFGIGSATTFKSQGFERNTSLLFKLGLQVNYNISDKFYIKGAIEGTIGDESLDGLIGGKNGEINRTVEGYAHGFIGVGYQFGGKRKVRTYNYVGTDNIERTYKILPAPETEDYTAPFVVRFFIDQYNIEEDQELNIAKVCKYLQQHPSARLLMTGHADPETATAKYNQALSERRCNSVLKYIDQHYGISHDRIDVKPMGDTERNFNEDFRWNRCVILTIIDK